MSIFPQKHFKSVTKTLLAFIFIIVFGFLSAGSYRTALAATTTLSFSGFESGAATPATGSDIGASGTGIFSVVTTPVTSGTYAGKIDSGASNLAIFNGFSGNWTTALDTYTTVKINANFSAFPAANVKIIYFMTSNSIASIEVSPTGTLRLVDGTGVQIGSYSSALNTGVWYRLELQVKVSTASTDYAEAKINGTTFAGAVTSNLGSLPVQWVQIGWNTAPGASKVMYLDDIAVINDTAPTFPGDSSVINLKPNALGTTNTFPTKVGTFTNRWDGVAEIPPSILTGWSQTATALVREQFNLVDSTAIASDKVINAVNIWALSKTGATSSASAIIIQENAVNFETAISTTSTASTYWKVYSVPPSSGGSWTKAKLDSLQSGLKSTAAAADTFLYDTGIMVLYSPAPGAITVGTAGSQVGTIGIGATGSYIGGAFTFVEASGLGQVNQITVTETGTVNANTNISNLKLYYKQEASCSTSIPADATLLGSASYFNASEKAAVLTGWGTSGMVTYNSGTTLADVAEAVAIDSANNVYVAGSQQTNGYDWAIRKYTSAGNLDTTWGTASSGMVTYNSGATQTDVAYAITTDSSNNIYVAGWQGTNTADWAIRKYNQNGVLCDGLGACVAWGAASTGMVTYNGGGDDEAWGITIDSTNNIYVSGTQGTNGNDWVVRKYNANGVLCDGLGACSAWGSGSTGMVTWNSSGTQSDIGYRITIDSTNNIYVVGVKGTNGGDLAVRKYNANGVLCDGLGACAAWGESSTGMVTYNSGGTQSDDFRGITIDSTNNIYVAGAQATNGGDFVVRKYTSAGVLASGWGDSGSGMVTYNSGGTQNDLANSVSVDSSNNIYVAGGQNATDWVIRKYTSSGVLDATWGTSGMVIYNSAGAQVDVAKTIVIDPNRNIYVVGYRGTNGTDWAVSAYSSGGVSPAGMAVGTSQGCLYAKLDVGSGASAGELVDLQISNPSTDVIVSAGTVPSAATVAIAGSTTITDPRPDFSLTPTDISFNPSSPTAGGNVAVTAVIHNNGTSYSATPETLTDRYYDLSNGASINSNLSIYNAGATGEYLAEQFTPTETFTLSKVQLNVAAIGTCGTLIITIRQESGGLPTGTTLATSNRTTCLPNPSDWTDFVFDVNPVLNIGTNYWIAAVGTGTSTSNTWTLATDSTTPTWSGSLAYDSNGGAENWTVLAGYDFLFRVYKGGGIPITVGFYEGDPDSGGTQVGTTQTISSIDASSTGSAQVSWIAGSAGAHSIYAQVDRAGVISEISEANNKSSNSVTVVAPVPLSVGTTGTQATPMAIPSTDNYVGGAFTFAKSAGSTNVGQIILSETGSVNATTNLSNLNLYYKQELSCSASIPSDATYFGGVQNFDASQQATIADGWGGTRGMVNYDSGGALDDYAFATAIDSANNTYVAGLQGTNGTDLVVRKYTSAGVLDTAWGSSGMVTYNSGGTQNDGAYGITIDSSRNIYVAGYQGTAGNDWVIRKYNASGVLCDGTGACAAWGSGSTGMIIYNSGGVQADFAYDIVIDSTSNIYVAGLQGTTGTDVAVRKYNANGVLCDGTGACAAWGSGSTGMVTYSSGAGNDSAQSIAIDSTNNIYVAGYLGINGNDLAVRKYNQNGVLCDGLGTCAAWGSGSTGMVTYSSGAGADGAFGIAIDSTNNVYVAGFLGINGNDWAVRKYNQNGVLCDGLGACAAWGSGSTGMVTYNSSGTLDDKAWDITIDSTNNIYVTGYMTTAATGNDLAVRKYNASGVLCDGVGACAAWGTGSTGMVTYSSGGTQGGTHGDTARTISIDSSNNIYVAGYQETNLSDWVVRKYTSAGALDISWGIISPDIVTYNSGGTQIDNPQKIAIDSNRSIYVVGDQATNGTDWAIRKYTSAGALDTTWGNSSSGMVTWNSGTTQLDTARAVVVNPADNSIYVTGNQQTNGYDIVVQKYNSAGVLDNSFSGDGISTPYNSGTTQIDVPYSITIDSSGNIYVVGYQATAGNDWVILKYTSAGILDTSFSGDGIQTYSSANSDIARAITIDSSNNIYVAGINGATNASDWVVRKYNQNGVLCDGLGACAAWGSGSTGMVTYNSAGTQNDVVYGITIDSTNNIYVAGKQNSAANGDDWAVRKYNQNGVLCDGLGACAAWGSGSTGMVTYNSGGTQGDESQGITIDSSNNIYVAGYQQTNGYDLIVRKYNASGVLCDGLGACAAWGTGSTGMVTYNSGAGTDAAYAITIDTSRRIYVFGSQATNGTDWVMIAYDSNGTLPTIMPVASQVCVYASVDVGSGAVNGNLLDLQITNPSTDVIVSSETVTPATVIALAGSTTLGTGSAAPTVDSITGQNPQTTAGLKSITINGTGFTNTPTDPTVSVGGTAATGVAFVSSTQLTATAPAKAAGDYNVVVTNPDTQFGTCAGCMQYIAPPSVTNVNPNSGLNINGTETVTITGSGIKVGTNGVKVDTTYRTTSGTASSATFTTPAHTAGAVTLRVYGASGTDANGIWYDYSSLTYGLPAPTVDSPILGQNPQTTAGGKSITINGTNFVSTPTMTVAVGVTLATTVTFVSSTQLTATAPAKAAGNYDVVVTNTADSQFGTCAGCMQYIAPPTGIGLNNVSPHTNLNINGGKTITITGSGIKVGTNGVKIYTTDQFDNTYLRTTSGTASSATFTTPAHAAGPVTLRIYGTSGTDANGIWYDYYPFTYGLPATSTLTSVVFNTGVTSPAYNSILWKGTLPSNTMVRFQFATSPCSNGNTNYPTCTTGGPWNFIGGTSCNSGSWYQPSEPNLPVQLGCLTDLNSKKYFKYKVQICSTSDCSATAGTQNPVIQDIIVNWSP